MKLVRSVRFTLLTTAMGVGCCGGLSGCGSNADKTVAAVEPNAQKKTEEMLKQMQLEAKEKYAKHGSVKK